MDDSLALSRPGGRRHHERVPLLLRPLARRRLANPAPDIAVRPLPPDVRHPRQLVVFLQTTHLANRRAHHPRPVRPTPRPARVRILHHPAPGKSHRAQRTRPRAHLSRPLHPERLRRQRPRPALHQLLHQGRKNRHRPDLSIS